jgi:uncharacterized protein (TIGR03066 family)
MRKAFNLWSLVIFVAVAGCFMSCSKDDDEGSNTPTTLIVGKWMPITSNADFDMMEFKSDNTMIFTRGGVIVPATWKLSGNTLTINIYILGKSDIYTIVELTNTTLEVTTDKGDTLVCKRV